MAETTKVGVLTLEQRDLVTGQYLEPSTVFYPVQDMNGNYVLSLIEIEQCVNEEFMWVKDLPLIEWKSPAPTPR